MGKKLKHQQSKQPLLFDPDEISTLISQAVSRDLGISTQVYADPNNPLAYARYRQGDELLKKFCSPNQDKDRLEAETFEKFLKVNQHMAQVNHNLLTSIPWHLSRLQSKHPLMWKVHMRARALIREVMTPFDEDEWFTECRNSSGSTLGVPYKDTSNEAKFSFPMTSTESCKLYFDRYRMFNPQLNRAISTWNSHNPTSEAVEIVAGSRATTVDKTTEKRRFICVEPTVNMFLQQGLMHMMYKRMKLFGLNVESLPDTNRQSAFESSITQKNATIDWSSASDSISPILLKWLLPQRWYSVVYQTRSPETFLKGTGVNLEMISSMGNAVTFPLETLVFWAYAHATHHTLTESGSTMFKEFEHRPTEITVFGDDCIVPTWMADEYISVMQKVGCTVNQEKTCTTGRFRESCGGDYLAGFNVRPFYLKAPPSNRLSNLEPWLYIIWNRLLKKYIQYFGSLSYVYDKELWRTLASLFARYKLNQKLVPDFLPDDAGLKLSFDIVRFHRHYPLKLSKIAVSKHGTHAYNYCRFVYWSNNQRSDDIRLALWLQKPVQAKRIPIGELSDSYLDRERGGYVVAKGVTCHWHVPQL